MIVYNPRQWNGLVVLLSLQGSPLPQGAAFGLVSAAIAVAVKFGIPNEFGLGEVAREDSLLDHPYSTSIFASLVSFLVAFRANLAYSRFWEGRTQLQRMSTMWADVGGMVIAFDENAKDLDDYDEWKADFVHLLSLLHGLAIMCLRCDQDLKNLVSHRTYTSDTLGKGAWEHAEDDVPSVPQLPRPVMAKSMAKGVTTRSGMSARKSYFNAVASPKSPVEGTAFGKSMEAVKRRVRRFSMPDTFIPPMMSVGFVAPSGRARAKRGAVEDLNMVLPPNFLGLDDDNDIESGRRALDQESESESGDDEDALPSLSSLPSRARTLTEPVSRREVRRRSVNVIADVSDLLAQETDDDPDGEGHDPQRVATGISGGVTALGKGKGLGLARFKKAATQVVIANNVLGALDPSTRLLPVEEVVMVKRQDFHAENPLGIIDGLHGSELEALEGADTLHAERVYVVCMWCQRAMVERYQKRGMRQGPPIVAQAYRSLCEGMNAFMQCKKIVDTPFPFPYAQCVMVALIVFMFTFPLQMCEVINDDFAAPVVSFLGVCVVVVVNRVATELEEPFMDDANDLPLADLHVDFNEKLNKLVAPRFWRTRWSHKSADGDERAHIIPLPELK